MDPIQWSDTIIETLEQQGIVGALLNRGATEDGDRYQPNKVYASYLWSGEISAKTTISFKIPAPEDRETVDINENGWIVSSRVSTDSWGTEWEDVLIQIPASTPINRSENFHSPGRFNIRVEILDNLVSEDILNRRINLENLREIGGILLSIRIIQNELPELHQLRPAGIDEDVFYRCSGLIGFLDNEIKELVFAPFALLPEPRRRPEVGPSLENAVENNIISVQISELLHKHGFSNLYSFQEEAIKEIQQSLNNGPSTEAIVLTVGTAAGKTEAFLIPTLEQLSEDIPHLGIQGLFLYPTKALEKDQAQRFFELLASFNVDRENPISIGVFDGDTERDIDKVKELEERGEFRSPFSKCPIQGCNGTILFTLDSQGNEIDTPTCNECNTQFPWIRYTRRQIQDYWPNLFLTVPDMLHRLISNNWAWNNQSFLGRDVQVCPNCGKYTPTTRRSISGDRQCTCGDFLRDIEPISLCPSVIVFDESHLLKGLFGSQVAIMISRMKQIARLWKHNPTFIGSSATIANPEIFGTQLFGGSVKVIKGKEIVETGAPSRFHLFVLPIQVTVLNAVGHVLTGCFQADNANHETNRVLIFSDSKQTVYRLEASLSEFYSTLIETVLPEGIHSIPTRSHTADLSLLERHRIELAFDNNEIRVLLATQTLEVGVDFTDLQLEIQTGATYSYNDYIQRVGRAGRRGVPALITCILRPQFPLDYYYFEHCRELVQISENTLDEVPLRTDNPFLVERHLPAVVQDYFINIEPAARLMWDLNSTKILVQNNREELKSYLQDVFIKTHSWDRDLINNAIDQGLNRILATLESPSENNFPRDRLSEIIELSLRGSGGEIPINSDDFRFHRYISMSGELSEESFDIEADEDINDYEELTKLDPNES